MYEKTMSSMPPPHADPCKRRQYSVTFRSASQRTQFSSVRPASTRADHACILVANGDRTRRAVEHMDAARQ